MCSLVAACAWPSSTTTSMEGRPGQRRNGLRGLRESSEPGLPRLSTLRPSARRVCVWPRLTPSTTLVARLAHTAQPASVELASRAQRHRTRGYGGNVTVMIERK